MKKNYLQVNGFNDGEDGYMYEIILHGKKYPITFSSVIDCLECSIDLMKDEIKKIDN